MTLQLAVTLVGTKFYPSCTQFRVGGSRTDMPDQIVDAFPRDNNPGTLRSERDTPGATYVFRVESRFAGHGWPALDEPLVVVFGATKWQANVYEWFWCAADDVVPLKLV